MVDKWDSKVLQELEMVTEKMKEAGSQIASDLINASISKAMGGLGGAKDWKEFKNNYKGENMDLIKKYVGNEINSVTAIYIAMRRTSNELA